MKKMDFNTPFPHREGVFFYPQFLLFVLTFALLFGSGCGKKGPLDPGWLIKIGEKNLEKGESDQFARAIKNFEEAYGHPKATIEEKLWSFYRLGVISELKGERNSAMTYFSGDEGDNTFYDKDPRILNLARHGLHQLMVKKKNRTYEEILFLEKSNRPFKASGEALPKETPKPPKKTPSKIMTTPTETRGLPKNGELIEIPDKIYHNSKLGLSF